MEKDERIAEFIGVMLGDGSIGIYDCKANHKIKKHYQLKVTLDSRNKDYIHYVSKLMKDVLDVEPKVYFKKKENAADIGTYKKDKITYALNNLGLKISPKWNNMEIPDRYTQGKSGLLVLRGLFDTDGSVTIFKNNGIIYPRIEIKKLLSFTPPFKVEFVATLGCSRYYHTLKCVVLVKYLDIRICPSPVQNQIINILKENHIKYTLQKLDKGKIKIRISGKKRLKNWFEIVGSSNQAYNERANIFLKGKVF